jgi:hypothetical protein
MKRKLIALVVFVMLFSALQGEKYNLFIYHLEGNDESIDKGSSKSQCGTGQCVTDERIKEILMSPKMTIKYFQKITLTVGRKFEKEAGVNILLTGEKIFDGSQLSLLLNKKNNGEFSLKYDSSVGGIIGWKVHDLDRIIITPIIARNEWDTTLTLSLDGNPVLTSPTRDGNFLCQIIQLRKYEPSPVIQVGKTKNQRVNNLRRRNK